MKTLQKNNIIKRKHKHLLNTARTLKFQTNLPKRFLKKYILTTTHIINKLPVKKLNWKTPYKILLHKTPLYNKLKTINCLYFITAINNKYKLKSRTKKYILLNYPFKQKNTNYII